MTKIILPILLPALALCSCTNGNSRGVITASGTIEATDVNVSSKVAGQILRLPIREGSMVKEGNLIAEIDHATLDLQLKQADAGVRLAEANLKMANQDLERVGKLFSKGSVTQKQRDDAETRAEVATAQLAQARAAADVLKKTIADCTIASPVSGTVTNKPVEVGELVAPGTVVATISQLNPVNLVIYVTEPELGSVKLGQTADVRIDTDPKRSFHGTVVYISPNAEFTPKNIQTKDERVKLVFGVKLEIDNQDGTLKPGLPADATIKIADIR